MVERDGEERSAAHLGPVISSADEVRCTSLARRHLELHLERIRVLLMRYIARHGHRMLQAGGKLGDLYVGFGEAGALFSEEPSASEPPTEREDWPSEAACDDRLASLDASIAELFQQWNEAESAELPIEELRALFRLDDTDLQLLLLAAAPQISVDLARLYTFAWADFAIKRSSVGFLAELAADDETNVHALAYRFEPGARLVSTSLVELRHVDVWGSPTPLIHRHVVVPDSVVASLLGHHIELPDTLQLVQRELESNPLTLAPDTQQRLREALRFAMSNPRGGARILLLGRRGSGRRTALCSMLDVMGQGLIEVRLDDLIERPDLLATAIREATLRNCVAFIDADEFVAKRSQEAVVRLGQLLSKHEHLVIVGAVEASSAIDSLLDRRFTIHFSELEPDAQVRFWTNTLEHYRIGSAELAEHISRQFDLTPGSIVDVVKTAAARATATRGGRDAVDGPLLSSIIRQRIRHDLGDLAEPISTSLTWEDVVLPEPLLKKLRGIAEHVSLSGKVLEEWSYRKRFPYGLGLSCLFNGPPGTGKTMVAGVIANELGRELYRIDLSRLTSKWVGETEKNLARVFSEAEHAQVILLFDEADSVFASRGKVDRASDRYANLEVNYLLQRIETFEGMCILTTNFEEGIDEAFKRRIRFRLDFPFPEAEQRARIWSALVTPESRDDDAIDFEILGEKFAFSGGHIKNAVLRAAFTAAGEGSKIQHDHLHTAALAEAREIGLLVKD